MKKAALAIALVGGSIVFARGAAIQTSVGIGHTPHVLIAQPTQPGPDPSDPTPTPSPPPPPPDHRFA